MTVRCGRVECHAARLITLAFRPLLSYNLTYRLGTVHRTPFVRPAHPFWFRSCLHGSIMHDTDIHPRGSVYPGPRNLPQVAVPISVALLLVTVSGCGRQETIEHYRVPSRAALWAENHVDKADDKGATSAPGEAAADRLRVPGMGMAPGAAPGMASGAPTGAAASGLTYDTPAGWTAAPGDQFSTAAFVVSEGDASARITISQLAGDGGGLLENVNRWRRQANLPALTDAELSAQTQPLTVAGVAGTYLECTGTNAQGAPEGLAGWIGLSGGRSWFVKIRGNADLVGRQRDTFKTFLQSLKIDSAQGGSDAN